MHRTHVQSVYLMCLEPEQVVEEECCLLLQAPALLRSGMLQVVHQEVSLHLQVPPLLLCCLHVHALGYLPQQAFSETAEESPVELRPRLPWAL
jgi:hypothetical protein